MDFPKRLLVVVDGAGVPFAGVKLEDIPRELLEDGEEVGVYGFRRMKKVEVIRRLVAPGEEVQGLEPHTE